MRFSIVRYVTKTLQHNMTNGSILLIIACTVMLRSSRGVARFLSPFRYHAAPTASSWLVTILEHGYSQLFVRKKWLPHSGSLCYKSTSIIPRASFVLSRSHQRISRHFSFSFYQSNYIIHSILTLFRLQKSLKFDCSGSSAAHSSVFHRQSYFMGTSRSCSTKTESSSPVIPKRYSVTATDIPLFNLSIVFNDYEKNLVSQLAPCNIFINLNHFMGAAVRAFYNPFYVSEQYRRQVKAYESISEICKP